MHRCSRSKFAAPRIAFLSVCSIGEEQTSALNPTCFLSAFTNTTMSGLCVDVEVIIGSKCRLGILL